MLLRVATYNIRRALGRDGRQSPERIVRVLRELQADVVALQEVAYRAEGIDDVLGYFAAQTGAEAIEGSTLRDAQGPYGNGLLCKADVTRVERFDISKRGREPRGVLDVDLAAGDSKVQIVATHLGLWPRERREQVDRLQMLLERSGADVQVLLGDFNEWLSWGRPLRRLYRTFGRSRAPATFPAHRPRLALDRIWVKPSGVARSPRVHVSAVSSIASDHLPLVAELDL
jgi:endonuclease/exonuclease/phosphatase family metal-dependent hydrolase